MLKLKSLREKLNDNKFQTTQILSASVVPSSVVKHTHMLISRTQPRYMGVDGQSQGSVTIRVLVIHWEGNMVKLYHGGAMQSSHFYE